jgi:hypothetical protein
MPTLLSTLVVALPIGTNWGLLASRGALFPALSDAGLTEGEVWRAWAALVLQPQLRKRR